MTIKNEHGYVNGWLSPKGALIPCKYGCHLDIAEEMFCANEKKNQPYQHVFEQMMLELANYVRIVGHHYQQSLNYICFPEQIADLNKKTTKEQVGWLLNHFEEFSKGQKKCILVHLK